MAARFTTIFYQFHELGTIATKWFSTWGGLLPTPWADSTGKVIHCGKTRDLFEDSKLIKYICSNYFQLGVILAGALSMRYFRNLHNEIGHTLDMLRQVLIYFQPGCAKYIHLINGIFSLRSTKCRMLI